MKLDIENGNSVSTLSAAAQINVEIGNINLLLFHIGDFHVDVHDVVLSLI